MRNGRAEYLREMVHELAEMAQQHDMELIGYLLRMAEAEVEQEIDKLKAKCDARRR